MTSRSRRRRCRVCCADHPAIPRTVRVFGPHSGPYSRRRSFSYIEAVGSVVVLGLAVVTGLHMHGSYIRGITVDVDTVAARELASGLMAEILWQSYEDPALNPGSFGRGAGETERADFDDVDDYDGWTESPPQKPDGTPMTDSQYDGFQRTVTVVNVDDATMGSVVTDGTSAAKRITVTVNRDGKWRAQLVAYRTRHDE